MQAQYRNFQDFSWEGLDAAKTTRHKLFDNIQTMLILEDHYKVETQSERPYEQIATRLLDDLDTPEALAEIHALVNGLVKMRNNFVHNKDLKLEERNWICETLN